MTAATTASTTPTVGETSQQVFTCKSCAIAFKTSDEQRLHYRSDHHRYNMQRRVAELEPLTAEEYNSKVVERRAEIASASIAKSWDCTACRKTYTTENAYLSHLNSKRHRENESQPRFQHVPSAVAPNNAAQSLDIPEDADEQTVNAIIDARIAAAESQLKPTSCLFCPATANDVSANLDHMLSAHSFFLPSVEHLVNIEGLLHLLASKIAVAHVCLYCAREFRTIDAARRHMLDKSHSKVPFESTGDRRELADFYKLPSSSALAARQPTAIGFGASDGPNAEDAAATEEDIPAFQAAEAESDEFDSDLDGQLPLQDDPFELRLRGGQRIGHRSLARYYKQNLIPLPRAPEDPHAPKALVKSLMSDKSSALVPARGGFGAFGNGMQVVKARNAGEAWHAGDHVRQHRDQKRREEFRTRVAFIANHQKHFRDPILGKIGS
ncbi:C2H2 type zinc-finger-domain-containing protein [Auriculariales sp. MPI-PUGE-AT-0066]|nr:C2H2 type zinc-finger-domain-containing protein [Auriculariales sp. MPI-PUGE-AT-0066]